MRCFNKASAHCLIAALLLAQISIIDDGAISEEMKFLAA
jgi:hypothetical protein